MMIDTYTLIGIGLVLTVVIVGLLLLVYEKGYRDGKNKGYSDGEAAGCKEGFLKAAESTVEELDRARRKAEREDRI